MSTPKRGCIFLDACVVFAEILGENSDVMEKFKQDIKRKGISCYLSETARSECENKIARSQVFFEKAFRVFTVGQFSFLRKGKGKAPDAPLRRSDLTILATLFNEIRKSTPAILQKPLRMLEVKMVKSVEAAVRQKKKKDFESFMQGFIGNALVEAASLKIQKVKLITNEQGFFRKHSALPDSRITDLLLQKIHGSRRNPFHKEDAENISSAWSHMNSNNQKTVFASFDFRSIIAHAENIFKLINLHVVDPLYAPNFL